MPPNENPAAAILILGMHRSGTSALTRMLNLLGVVLGDQLLPPHACNPKGLWEHQEAVRIDEAIFTALNLTWHVPSPLPPAWTTYPAVATLRAELQTLLKQELADKPLWGVKDPRLCRLLPLWQPLLAELGRPAGFVLMLRDPDEVAASLYKRDLFPIDKSLLLWLYYMLEAERETRDSVRVVVTFDELLTDWDNVAQRIADNLAIQWPQPLDTVAEAIQEHIEPAQRHQQGAHSLEEAAEPIRHWTDRAYAAFQRLVAGATDAHIDLDAVYAELTAWTEQRRTLLAAQRQQPLDIVVPVFRGVAETQRCLDSLLQTCSEREDVEIIVIDDGSPETDLVAYLDRLAATTRLTLLRNDGNQGFVRTVNRGLGLHPERDVVLLNSDTEVAAGWFDRLRRCAYANEWIGIVTPFSNNATICSYPRFCHANSLPDGYDVAALDRVFRDANAERLLDIPTAVGFCMYIRRDCLDTVGYFNAQRFGAGYGEENDFCMRAFKAGWRNVLCADVFVYHTGGVSFGPSQAQLRERGMAALLELHPDYGYRVADFIEQDSVRPLRAAVDRQRALNATTEALQVLAERDKEARELWREQQNLQRTVQFLHEIQIKQERARRHVEDLLAGARDTLAQRELALNQAEQFVREREADISQLNTLAENLAQEKRSLHRTIEELSAVIVERDNTLRHAEQLLNETRETLAQRESALYRAEQYVREREADIDQLKAQIADLENQLTMIHASRSWRYTRIFRQS